jgi:hypothetical protein
MRIVEGFSEAALQYAVKHSSTAELQRVRRDYSANLQANDAYDEAMKSYYITVLAAVSDELAKRGNEK